MLCGAAQSLTQIVVFRLLQGRSARRWCRSRSGPAGHLLVKERGTAMGIFGVAVMVGPVLGPVIGGWLTEN